MPTETPAAPRRVAARSRSSCANRKHRPFLGESPNCRVSLGRTTHSRLQPRIISGGKPGAAGQGQALGFGVDRAIGLAWFDARSVPPRARHPHRSNRGTAGPAAVNETRRRPSSSFRPEPLRSPPPRVPPLSAAEIPSEATSATTRAVPAAFLPWYTVYISPGPPSHGRCRKQPDRVRLWGLG
jgi:hypothetical protein